MPILADKRRAPHYADAVVSGLDSDGRARAQLDLVCRRSGIDPEILLEEARRRSDQIAPPLDRGSRSLALAKEAAVQERMP